MFTTFIVQPIFNLLVFIYAILPVHNFGLSIVIFTIVVRLLMWPLVKKQINQAKAMRELAPEIKKIKAAAKGDRQKESALTMELYKEKEINPFASIGILIVQLPIIFGLYSGLRRIVTDHHQIVSFSYGFIHHLPWMDKISHNINLFDDSLFGVVNLTRTALGPDGIYWSAMVIVVASAISQYFQSKQLMPHDPEARGLRAILSDAGKGKQADSGEMNAAVSKGTQYLVPIMVLFISLRLAVALPLYWLTSSIVAYIQQDKVLKKDTKQADASVPDPIKIESKVTPRKNKKTKKSANKRRRR